jgi:hypothetical protein
MARRPIEQCLSQRSVDQTSSKSQDGIDLLSGTTLNADVDLARLSNMWASQIIVLCHTRNGRCGCALHFTARAFGRARERERDAPCSRQIPAGVKVAALSYLKGLTGLETIKRRGRSSARNGSRAQHQSQQHVGRYRHWLLRLVHQFSPVDVMIALALFNLQTSAFVVWARN